MKRLKERIVKDGKVIGTEILKVDNFLNHQVDVPFIDEIGKAFYELFKDAGVTRILTIEASGIPVAFAAARFFGVPMVYAKKFPNAVKDESAEHLYQSEVYSFTKQASYNIRVTKEYIRPGDKILIIDDFLANGKAAAGLADIVHQAGAEVAGIGIVIEKGFQNGRQTVETLGYRIESLAIVDSMGENGIVFRE